MEFHLGLWAILGFFFAAYAVVGNDALQTLGTFINSNDRLHWSVLFLFAAGILVLTFTVGWIVNGGDPSWGRLASASKYPAVDVRWYHTIPPLMLLVITRLGVPVSTSFMVLTVFATVGGLTSMLQKSLIGYGLAFSVGLGLFLILSRTAEKFFREHHAGDKAPWGLATIVGILTGITIYYVPPLIDPEASYGAGTCIGIAVAGLIIDVVASMAVIRFEKSTTSIAVSLLVAAVAGFGLFQVIGGGGAIDFGLFAARPVPVVMVAGLLLFAVLFTVATQVSSGRIVYWIILQWITTGYLWGVWLIQDFANIFVFLPRELSALEGFGAMAVICALLGYTFWNAGGPVQKILKSKTAVTDIRSATVIDFVYATLLFFFKEVSDIPMSTTFVFLGLIAGREYGFALSQKAISLLRTSELALSDASKAFVGLALSINMAIGLPWLAQSVSAGSFDVGALVPTFRYGVFLLVVNLMLIPVGIYLSQPRRDRMVMMAGVLGAAVIAFVAIPLE
jgi:hypothetical protein